MEHLTRNQFKDTESSSSSEISARMPEYLRQSAQEGAQEARNQMKLEAFEQSLASKPIESHPLERYDGRYETEFEQHGRDSVHVKTKVKGTEEFCYDNIVDFKKGAFVGFYNYRQRPSYETALIHQTYDSDAGGDPMHFSDISYCQISKAVERFGGRYGITDVKSFPLRALIGEDIQNEPSIATINRFAASGKDSQFSRGSQEFNTIMETPIGKSKALLLRQRFPEKEISSIKVNREADGSNDEISQMVYTIRNKR